MTDLGITALGEFRIACDGGGQRAPRRGCDTRSRKLAAAAGRLGSGAWLWCLCIRRAAAAWKLEEAGGLVSLWWLTALSLVMITKAGKKPC